MTEVIDFEIKNEYNIWLLVRRPGGDRWEDFRTLRRTQGLIRDGILEWMGKGKEPRWWEGKKNG